ncbi:putative POM121-like protein 1-like [Mustela erminea]|uniref:putative POM121-like protein 1-like n=1 Tax=Mustela erminea TaxID=36723 RepID=UPI001386A261|nr:putative POM121-like protein 1-like [Mustela erminea]
MAGTHCTPIPLPQFSLQAQEICCHPEGWERGGRPLHGASAGLILALGGDPTEAVHVHRGSCTRAHSSGSRFQSCVLATGPTLCSRPSATTWQLKESAASLVRYPQHLSLPDCCMGTSLNRPCPSPQPRALRDPHLPGGLVRPHRAPCGRRQLLAPRARPAVHAPGSTHRRSSKYPASWQPHSVLAAWRRYSMILATPRFLLGLLTSSCRWGCRLKVMLSAAGSQVSCRHRCESIVDTVTHCVLQKQVVTGLWPSAPRNVHEVSRGERMCRDPRESGKGRAQIETHRKDPKGAGAPQGAFRPLGVHGGLSSFVPRPGPLLRAVPRKKSSKDPYNKKSPSSHRSSCPTRNAITSSYSSTRGCYPVQRRRGLATSPAPRPPRSPKKVSQESPLCPARVPALCQKNHQLEKDADNTTRQKAAQRNCSSPADCSRPRKRKFPLLPHRRGEPLRLPSPPELGFRVTAEDLDREKTAALQRIQDALRGDTEATCSCGPTCPSSALALPSAVAAPLPASDSHVTFVDCSRSSQPLLLGSHPGCSESNFASTQALSMQSRDNKASVTVPTGLPALPGRSGNPGSTGQAPFGAVGGQWPGASPFHSSPPHGQPAAQAPNPLQSLSTAVVQLSLGSDTQAGYAVPLPASASRGTRASAQPGSATSLAVLAPGAAAAPGLTAVTQLPGAMSHAGTISQQPHPPGGSTMPARISMGLSTAPPGLGRGDDADLCSSFGALNITAGTSRAPRGPQGSRASLGPNTGGRPRQSTLSGTAGASTTNQPVSGAPSAPSFSHIPRHLTKKTKKSSRSDGCSTSSKAACRDGSILASPPSGPTSLVSKAQSSLATKNPSSPAQHLIKCKRAAPCNKPSSATSQPIAAAPGLAAVPQVPGAVSHAGPNSQQPGPQAGNTMLAPISMGLSAAPPGLGRGEDVADLCSSFGALSIAAGTSRAPSGPQGSRASLGPNTGGRPRQNTLSGTAGAGTTNQPMSGAPSAPSFSHIPRHLTKKTKKSSRSDGCSTSSKATCRGVLTFPPSGPTSLVSKAQSSLATKNPSSPAQHRRGRKRSAPCNKPFSSTSQPTSLGPKRQRLC